MKVRVRAVKDYSMFDNEDLIKLLQDRDREIADLRLEMQLVLDEQEQQIDILLEERDEAEGKAREWRVRAEKLEAALRAEDEKKKFYSVLEKAQDEGWLSLFEPNMTDEQRGWLDEWKKEEAQKEKATFSKREDYLRRRSPVCCCRVVFF